jgi:hypothetical protein
MTSNPGRALRIGVVIVVLWCLSAAAAWFTVEPGSALIGVKAPGIRLSDEAALARSDLASVQTLLEQTNVWGMQRDGQPVAPKVVVTTVEKKIIWSIAATVVRPKQRYLLVLDQETKIITQVNEGELLPDGSKLLQVTLNSYMVRDPKGKKRTIETSL